jgi:cyclomaltodextrinase / maltogenic alpha-amylase / neopullulanase
MRADGPQSSPRGETGPADCELSFASAAGGLRRRELLLRGAVAAGALALPAWLRPPRAEAWPGARERDTRWIDDAVVYGIPIHLLGNGNLVAVESRLDELETLGVTTLWLSPLTDSAQRPDFGYDPIDFMRLRPDLGKPADLHRLVDAAHRRSMRVVMDFVPNHTARDHPWFRAARRGGPGSRFWEYYERDRTGRPRFYFDYRDLVNLNYDLPAVRRRMIEALEYWLHAYDIDGFRMDVAWGPRRRHPAFWPDCIARLRARKPDLLLLAEGSARDPYFTRCGFDSAYDWAGGLGEWAWRRVFSAGPALASRLQARIGAGQPAGTGGHVFRFLNNNDTGRRFVTRHGPELTRVATLLLLTLPGLPGLYLGDEVGAEYDPYRRVSPVKLTDRFGLRDFHRRAIALRREMPVLRSAEYLPLAVSGGEGRVFAYGRTASGRSPPTLVVLNFAARRARSSVTLSGPMMALAHSSLYDAFNRRDVDARVKGRQLELELEPWAGHVLTA